MRNESFSKCLLNEGIKTNLKQVVMYLIQFIDCLCSAGFFTLMSNP